MNLRVGLTERRCCRARPRQCSEAPGFGSYRLWAPTTARSVHPNPQHRIGSARRLAASTAGHIDLQPRNSQPINPMGYLQLAVRPICTTDGVCVAGRHLPKQERSPSATSKMAKVRYVVGVRGVVEWRIPACHRRAIARWKAGTEVRRAVLVLALLAISGRNSGRLKIPG